MQTRTGKIISGILLFGAAITIIVTLLWGTNALGWRAWRLIEVENFIGAKLPDGARDVRFATDNQKTRIVWLRFTLPAQTDLSDFLNQPGLDTELCAGFTPFPGANPAEAGMTWWTPQTAQTYSGFYVIREGKMVELLLDQTDPANPIVYLRVYALGME